MEYIKGPTENGGAYAKVFYYDNERKSATKENATNGYKVEYDEEGNRICESYFIIEDKYEYIDIKQSDKN